MRKTRPRPTTADARRVPRDRSHSAALAVRRDLRVLRRAVGPQSRAEDRLPRLAQHGRDREHRLPEPAAVSLSQPRPAMPADCNEAQTTTAASRVRTRCWSTTTRTPPRRASGTTRATSTTRSRCRRKFTLNVGVRYDRYSSFLPEQGNPGTGPFATPNIFPYKGEETTRSTRRSCRASRRFTT